MLHVTHGGTYQKTVKFTVKNVTNSNLNSIDKIILLSILETEIVIVILGCPSNCLQDVMLKV